MRPHSTEDTVIEISLSDHSNLNCRSCDHFSPIAKPKFADLSEFQRDIEKIAELSELRLGSLYLCGGEPLLNKNIHKFLFTARCLLPNTKLCLFTNGLLLLNTGMDKFWVACRENAIILQLTKYPINLNFNAINNKICFEKVKLEVFQAHTDFFKYTLKPDGGCQSFPVVECYQMNQCSVLRGGRIYMCPLSAKVEHFNTKYGHTFDIPGHDYIDIYTAQSFQEIAEFVSRPAPFCRYCDIGSRERNEWSHSYQTMDGFSCFSISGTLSILPGIRRRLWNSIFELNSAK